MLVEGIVGNVGGILGIAGIVGIALLVEGNTGNEGVLSRDGSQDPMIALTVSFTKDSIGGEIEVAIGMIGTGPGQGGGGLGAAFQA